jgi:hypothetical protein
MYNNFSLLAGCFIPGWCLLRVSRRVTFKQSLLHEAETVVKQGFTKPRLEVFALGNVRDARGV